VLLRHAHAANFKKTRLVFDPALHPTKNEEILLFFTKDARSCRLTSQINEKNARAWVWGVFLDKQIKARHLLSLLGQAWLILEKRCLFEPLLKIMARNGLFSLKM
jgi:hypothetical protein